MAFFFRATHTPDSIMMHIDKLKHMSVHVLAALGAFAICASAQAHPVADAGAPVFAAGLEAAAALQSPAAAEPKAPRRSDLLPLKDLTHERSVVLHGIRNSQQLEFTVRQDQLVTSAALQLVATPSPALLPRLSHLRVYLNDELMGVVQVADTTPGAAIRQAVPLDPFLMGRFNRIRLEFVGHYTDICEDLAHSSLWLDISQQTRVLLEQEALPLRNDLSFFPEPFFDANDMRLQPLAFVFAGAPSAQTLQAAGVLASYFGSESDWRELDVSVHYDALPQGHAIIFATNDSRPGFLADHPKVDGPVIDLIGDPDNPYIKRLLVLGRDEADLLRASTALAVGTPLLRGQSVAVNEVMELIPRKPYDAPKWVPTDRPVLFSELVDYAGQLSVSGLRPTPVALNLDLPPDLFVWRNNGVPMQLRYRYTPLLKNDGSRLTMSLNEQYVGSYLLEAGSDGGVLTKMRLPLLEDEGRSASKSMRIPGMKLGANNRMQFDFSFATVVGSAQKDECRTLLPVDVRAEVDGSSSIDFSGFDHYLEMPNLWAFAGSAFPFSRMADLSDTIVVAPAQPTREQAATVLETLAFIGARVGYPAMKVRVADDWEAARNEDADILLVGNLPRQLAQQADANFILNDTESRLRRPRNNDARHWRNSLTAEQERAAQDATVQVQLQSAAPMAAIVGMQSPSHPQRSVVGLLATGDDALPLLRSALKDTGKRDAMYGSVVLIRESGVAGATVGDSYFVGYLPWWRKLWYQLSDKPVTLAAVAVFAILLAALLLWRVLSWVARRRLGRDA